MTAEPWFWNHLYFRWLAGILVACIVVLTAAIALKLSAPPGQISSAVVVSEPGIEDILRSRLPEQRTVDARQQQILQAIDALKKSDPNRAGADTDHHFFPFAAISISAICLLLFAAFVRNDKALSRSLAVAGAASIAAESILGGLTAFKTTFQHQGPLVQILWDRYQTFENAQDAAGGNIALECSRDAKPMIETFESGKSDLSAQRLSQLLNEVRNVVGSTRPTAFLLVGSADKQRLKPGLADSFGSNAGLAQRRTQDVVRGLEQAWPGVPMISLGRGPLIDGRAPAQTESDRSVSVCVVLQGRKTQSSR